MTDINYLKKMKPHFLTNIIWRPRTAPHILELHASGEQNIANVMKAIKVSEKNEDPPTNRPFRRRNRHLKSTKNYFGIACSKDLELSARFRPVHWSSKISDDDDGAKTFVQCTKGETTQATNVYLVYVDSESLMYTRTEKYEYMR